MTFDYYYIWQSLFIFPIADNSFIKSVLYFWISKIHLTYTFNLWSGKNWECNCTSCTHASITPVIQYICFGTAILGTLNKHEYFTCVGNNARIKLNLGVTPARTHSISGLKSRVLKFTFLAYNDGEKWPRIFYFEIHRAPSELLLPSAKKSAQ